MALRNVPDRSAENIRDWILDEGGNARSGVEDLNHCLRA